MNRKTTLSLILGLVSFTLYAQQQEGFVARTTTDMGFNSFQATLEMTYHPLARNGVPIISGDNRDGYVIGLEDNIKKRVSAVKAAVDTDVFDPDAIAYQEVKYDVLNPCRYGASNWYFDRAGLLYALRYYYGGMVFQDQDRRPGDATNILIDQDFFPNGDKRYANRAIVAAVAGEVVAELTVDQVTSLPETRVPSDKDAYIPIYKRTVDEVYDLLSLEHDGQGFDFMIGAPELEAVSQTLPGGAAGPSLKQRLIEAKRQKILAYVKWTYSLPRTQEAFRILSFVLRYNDIPDVTPTLVVSWARDIAEWRLANPNGGWRTKLNQSMKQGSISRNQPVNWLDLYVGARFNAYSSTGTSDAIDPDIMAKLGFGYNVGNSYAYLTGYVGLPIAGQPSISALEYEGRLDCNVRFVKFFEVYSGLLYDNTGSLVCTVKPNFIVLSFLEIGGGAEINIMPSVDASVFGEVFFGKTIGVNISYRPSTAQTALSAIVKF